MEMFDLEILNPVVSEITEQNDDGMGNGNNSDSSGIPPCCRCGDMWGGNALL